MSSSGLLRSAIRALKEKHGVVALAKKIGVTPVSLQAFLNGSETYAKTLAKMQKAAGVEITAIPAKERLKLAAREKAAKKAERKAAKLAKKAAPKRKAKVKAKAASKKRRPLKKIVAASKRPKPRALKTRSKKKTKRASPQSRGSTRPPMASRRPRRPLRPKRCQNPLLPRRRADMVAKGIKRKRKSSRPLPSGSKTFKEAFGGAVGAALGALIGASFVRDPNGMTDLFSQLIKIAGDPNALEELIRSTIPQNEWAWHRADDKQTVSPSDPRTKRGKAVDADFEPKTRPRKRRNRKSPPTSRATPTAL